MSRALGLPGSWTSVPLELIAELNPRFAEVNEGQASRDVHFVPMSAVDTDFGGADVSARRSLDQVSKGYKSFRADDVLFAKITPCMENGKVAVVPPLKNAIGFGSTEFHVIRSYGEILPKWLGYFLSQVSFRKAARQNMTGSAGQMRVPTGWLSAVLIPLAPLTEQHRVVAILDELFSEFAAGVVELKAAQKKLVRYRNLIFRATIFSKDTISEEVGDLPSLLGKWQWARLGDLVAASSYGTSVKCREAHTAIPVLRIPNIVAGFVDRTKLKYASSNELKLSDEDFLKTGDVLIVRTNGSIRLVGRAAAIDGDLPSGYYFASYLLRLRCIDSSVVPRWIAAYFASPEGRVWIEARAASSAGQHNVSLSTLLGMPIPIAPLDVLRKALAQIESVNREAIALDAEISKGMRIAAAQRQNILKFAFSGHLVPQDPSDESANVLLDRICAERAARLEKSSPKRRKTKATA